MSAESDPCHICGKVKRSSDGPDRAAYLLAFHYDRRHRGWTEKADGIAAGRVEVSQTHQAGDTK